MLAAAVALAVAWQGVGVVANQVTEDRPAALSAAEVRDRLEETTTSTTSTTSTTTSSSSAPGEATTSTAGAAVPGTQGAPTSVPSGGPAPTSTSPPATTATTAPADPGTTTTTAPAGETRTYNLVGGSVSLRFSPSGVTVVLANPNPGFDVSQQPEQGNGVKVEFRSDTHRSRVDGWWDGGPQDRVREEPDS